MDYDEVAYYRLQTKGSRRVPTSTLGALERLICPKILFCNNQKYYASTRTRVSISPLP